MRIFAGAPYTIYMPGNDLSATVDLIYINLQPEYEHPSSTRFRQYKKFGQIWVGALSSSATLKNLYRVWILVHSYLYVRFGPLAPLTLDI